MRVAVGLVAGSCLGAAAARPSGGGRLMVLGIGGAGCNAIEYFAARGLPRALLACANTEAVNLDRSAIGLHIQLGRSGLGAGGDPAIGRLGRQSSADAIQAALARAQVLCVVAGMGGGTGSGASPVIARLAREAGVATIGLAVMPFGFEGQRRRQAAGVGLRALRACVDQLAVFRNEDLMALGDDITQDDAFARINEAMLGMLPV